MKKAVREKLAEVRNLAIEYTRVGASLLDFIDDIEMGDAGETQKDEAFNECCIKNSSKVLNYELQTKYPNVSKESIERLLLEICEATMS